MAVGFLGETILAATAIFPYINDRRALGPVAFLATLGTGFFLLVSTVVSILLFGPHMGGTFSYIFSEATAYVVVAGTPYSVLPEVAIPLLLLVVAMLRAQRRNERSASPAR